MNYNTTPVIDESMQEIIDVLDLYAWCFDANDMTRLKALFSEHAVVEGKIQGTDITWGPTTGRDAIALSMSAVRDAHPHWRRHQLTTPLVVDLSPDQATVKMYLSLSSCQDGNTPRIEVTGEYLARCSKTSGDWKIDYLGTVLDSEF